MLFWASSDLTLKRKTSERPSLADADLGCNMLSVTNDVR
jgi:hypothetical protein